MSASYSRSKNTKTVAPIKIIDNQTTNSESTSKDNEWQQQKHAKRSLPSTPTTPTNHQEKNQNFSSL